MRNFGQK